MLDRNQQLTPHFKLSEFLRPEDPDPIPAIVENIRKLAEALEPIRIENDAPIIVDSGYRSHQRQRELYDALNGKQPVVTPGHSEHELGNAADLRGINATLQDRLWMNWPGGMGRYDWGVHLDLGPHRRWAE